MAQKSRQLLLVLASGIVACAGSDRSTPESGPVDLRAEDSGRLMEIESGRSIVIRLESNPGTGFEWEVRPFDERVLVREGREFLVDSELEGDPGLDVFRFSALGPGRTDLELAYRRSWEVDVEPVETFTVTIVVG